MNLERLLKPRSIAIIGASQNLLKPSGRSLRYLLEQNYEGDIFPVNPKYDEVEGLKCYPDIESLPENIDSSIVSVPADRVNETVKQLIERKVKSAVIFSSGFIEVGGEGKRLQQELEVLGKEILLLGPNCIGLINHIDKTPMTFTTALEDKEILPGSIAFVTQSGAFGAYIFALAKELGLGFSYWVSTGNEATLQFNDFLNFLADDEDTNAIAGYIEDIRDGNRFLESAKYCLEKGKPIVILKIGQSEDGAKVVTSHTGALAGSYEVYNSIFRQKGVVQASDIYELLDFSQILANASKLKGNRTAIISISGGAGAHLADKCEHIGLEVAKLTPENKSKMEESLPSFGSAMKSIIDVTAQMVTDSEAFKRCLNICLEDKNVDVVIIFLGLLKEMSQSLVNDVIEAANKSDKLLLVTWVAAPPNAVKTLQENNILVYPEPVRCVKAAHVLYDYHKRRDKILDSAKGISGKNQLLGQTKKLLKNYQHKSLSEYESRGILERYGIEFAEGELATNLKEAYNIADKIGYPVVLKVDSPDIPHKTDLGLVKVNIATSKELKYNFEEINETISEKVNNSKINGIWVQEMLQVGTEMLLGLKQDPVFGPMVVYGLGGVFVEIFEDICMRQAPLNSYDIDEMIENVKGNKLLIGARGRAIKDIESVKNSIKALSDLAVDLSDEISEIDINPMFVFEEGKGCKAADALIILM